MNANCCFFSGILGNDAEIKITPSGKAVARFSLGVSENRKDGDGKWSTTYQNIPCEVWAEKPEKLDVFKKSATFFVQGKAVVDQWKDQDGKNKSRLKIVVLNFEQLQKRERRDSAEQKTTAQGDGFDDDFSF